jgi:catechol 2,3-dioxygenase-like lactoylglutathione lyase family enzyme
MSGHDLSRRGLLAAATLPLLPAHSLAQIVGQTSPGPVVGGWREAVVIVPDPAPWIETLTAVGGWEIAHRGPPDRALNAFWSLPAGARTEQALMRNIGTDKGFIRLVKVFGAEQRPIRPDDQAWESGGVQALDLRVADMEATRAALHARGWRAPSDPVRYKTYGVEVIQWAPSSPDGVRLSFIQRIAPPLQGWAELKRWSRTSNAAVTVKDMAAAEAFYGGVLGLKLSFTSDTLGSDGPNVMGLPWSLAAQSPVVIKGYAAPGGDAAVELISIPAAAGRDHAAAAHPPNLGVAALRFVVGDAPGLARRFADRAGPLACPLQAIDVAPYGPCRIFAVSAPDGVRLEFVEPSVKA